MSRSRIEEWTERFRASTQVVAAPAPLVVQFTRELTPGFALDLACGPGRNALYLAERGWRVTALDGSQLAIDQLRASNPSIDAHVVDLETAEYEIPPDSHDLVLSCYYLQRGLIPVMKSALRPNGLLIMIVNLAGPDHPRGTPTRAYPNELPAFFEGWRLLHYREWESGDCGQRHAVAELVARAPG